MPSLDIIPPKQTDRKIAHGNVVQATQTYSEDPCCLAKKAGRRFDDNAGQSPALLAVTAQGQEHAKPLSVFLLRAKPRRFPVAGPLIYSMDNSYVRERQ